MSNIAGRITASAEMLEPAIAELLRLIPETWQAYSPDDLSDTKAQALFLLTAAGMVERRERLRLRMVNHPLIAEATIAFTGEYGGVEALELLLASLWADWQDAYRKWKRGDTGNVPPAHCERLEPSEWRLTDQGVLAHKSLTGGEQNDVFDFVLKRGGFGGQPREMPDGRISQRKPVRGVGALVKMDKAKPETAGHRTVNIGNWGAGGDAFGQAFGPVIVKVFDAMQAKAAPAVIQIGSIKAGQSIVAGGSITAAGNIEAGGRVYAGQQSFSSADESPQLAWSIVRRSALWLVVLAGVECAVGLCAWHWGTGENLWQKVINSWPVFAGGLGVVLIGYPFLLGRRRWRVLKFWKEDDK
jgi:hypothetical protein